MPDTRLPLKWTGGPPGRLLLMQELCKDSPREVRASGSLKAGDCLLPRVCCCREALWFSFYQLDNTHVPFPLGLHIPQASYLTSASFPTSMERGNEIYPALRCGDVCGGRVVAVECWQLSRR